MSTENGLTISANEINEINDLLKDQPNDTNTNNAAANKESGFDVVGFLEKNPIGNNPDLSLDDLERGIKKIEAAEEENSKKENYRPSYLRANMKARDRLKTRAIVKMLFKHARDNGDKRAENDFIGELLSKATESALEEIKNSPSLKSEFMKAYSTIVSTEYNRVMNAKKD